MNKENWFRANICHLIGTIDIMRVSSLGAFVPIFWIGAEIVAYGVIIQQFGISIAILIGITSLALGIITFRRLGMGLASISNNGSAGPEAILRTLKKIGWAALGALLLILPGFISNFAGIVMIMINPGAWLTPQANRDPVDDSIIDLEARDWQSDTNQSANPGTQMSQRKND